jgi:hypothetical protein
VIKNSSLIFLIVFAIETTGCNIPVKPTPINSQDQVSTVVANQLTEITAKITINALIPTTTSPPVATEAFTVTPTQITTPSATIPKVDFSGHQVYVSYLENEVMQVSITVPNGINGEYSATFDGKPYTCFTYTSKTLDRLICHGALLRSQFSYKFQVFSKGSEIPIFERIITVPEPKA